MIFSLLKPNRSSVNCPFLLSILFNTIRVRIFNAWTKCYVLFTCFVAVLWVGNIHALCNLSVRFHSCFELVCESFFCYSCFFILYNSSYGRQMYHLGMVTNSKVWKPRRNFLAFLVCSLNTQSTRIHHRTRIILRRLFIIRHRGWYMHCTCIVRVHNIHHPCMECVRVRRHGGPVPIGFCHDDGCKRFKLNSILKHKHVV